MSKKHRIVIDTNVFISALKSKKGASYKLLFETSREKYEQCISPALVFEYESAAKRENLTINFDIIPFFPKSFYHMRSDVTSPTCDKNGSFFHYFIKPLFFIVAPKGVAFFILITPLFNFLNHCYFESELIING